MENKASVESVSDDRKGVTVTTRDYNYEFPNADSFEPGEGNDDWYLNIFDGDEIIATFNSWDACYFTKDTKGAKA